MAFDRVLFRAHSIERMFELVVSEPEVRGILEDGEVVEEVAEPPDDIKRIYLGVTDSRPLHVVAVDRAPERVTIVITVYEPTSDRWTDGFRRRRTT